MTTSHLKPHPQNMAVIKAIIPLTETIRSSLIRASGGSSWSDITDAAATPDAAPFTEWVVKVFSDTTVVDGSTLTELLIAMEGPTTPALGWAPHRKAEEAARWLKRAFVIAYHVLWHPALRHLGHPQQYTVGESCAPDTFSGASVDIIRFLSDGMRGSTGTAVVAVGGVLMTLLHEPDLVAARKSLGNSDVQHALLPRAVGTDPYPFTLIELGGRPVWRVAREGWLTYEEVVWLLRGAMLAVQELANRGIVHEEVSIDNLTITVTNTVVEAGSTTNEAVLTVRMIPGFCFPSTSTTDATREKHKVVSCPQDAETKSARRAHLRLHEKTVEPEVVEKAGASDADVHEASKTASAPDASEVIHDAAKSRKVPCASKALEKAMGYRCYVEEVRLVAAQLLAATAASLTEVRDNLRSSDSLAAHALRELFGTRKHLPHIAMTDAISTFSCALPGPCAQASSTRRVSISDGIMILSRTVPDPSLATPSACAKWLRPVDGSWLSSEHLAKVAACVSPAPQLVCSKWHEHLYIVRGRPTIACTAACGALHLETIDATAITERIRTSDDDDLCRWYIEFIEVDGFRRRGRSEAGVSKQKAARESRKQLAEALLKFSRRAAKASDPRILLNSCVTASSAKEAAAIHGMLTEGAFPLPELVLEMAQSGSCTVLSDLAALYARGGLLLKDLGGASRLVARWARGAWVRRHIEIIALTPPTCVGPSGWYERAVHVVEHQLYGCSLPDSIAADGITLPVGAVIVNTAGFVGEEARDEPTAALIALLELAHVARNIVHGLTGNASVLAEASTFVPRPTSITPAPLCSGASSALEAAMLGVEGKRIVLRTAEQCEALSAWQGDCGLPSTLFMSDPKRRVTFAASVKHLSPLGE